MKVYFDLSPGTDRNRAAHIRGWEFFLSNLAEGDDSIVSTKAAADVVVYTAAAGMLDSTFWSSVKPLSREEATAFVWDWADAPLGRMSGFYCSLPRSIFDARRHRTMCYPLDFNEFVEEFPLDDAIYKFGFVGGLTSGVRSRLFANFEQRAGSFGALIRQQGGDWQSMFDRTGLPIKREYAEALRRTKFALCPRGAGVGSIRLFEALKAGRPPVIISDGYVLPEGIQWDACSIRIRERDIRYIPRLIEERLPDWQQMATKARRAWVDNFSETTVLRYLTREIESMQVRLDTALVGRNLRFMPKMIAELVNQRSRPVAGSLMSFVRR